MRVLYVLPTQGFGGAERQATLHVSLLPRFGVEVVPLFGPDHLVADSVRQSHPIVTSHMVRELDRPAGRLGYAQYLAGSALTWLRGQGVLARIIQGRRIDVVLASRAIGWTMAGVVSHLLGVPQVWRAGSRPATAAQRRSLARYARVFGPRALVTNCAAVEREVAPLVGSPSYVIHNGVDIRRFDPERVLGRLRAALGLGERVPVVGIAARPAPGKGLELLGDSILRLQRQWSQVRFLVAGAYGDWLRHYEEHFARRGLGGQVRFLGHVQQIEAFYECCDVVVLSSDDASIEGAPNALLEAMAMRRAVVATAVGGVPEIIRHRRDGLLVPAGDPVKLAGAIGELLADARLRRDLGAGARESVVTRFSDEVSVSRLAQLLRRVVGEPAIRRSGRYIKLGRGRDRRRGEMTIS